MSKKLLQMDDQEKTFVRVGNVRVPAYIVKKRPSRKTQGRKR